MATAAIEITEPEIALSVAEKVRAGAVITVEWNGTVPYERDYLTIVPEAAADGTSGSSYAYVDDGSPVTLLAPEEQGLYEVRYVLDQGHRTLSSADGRGGRSGMDERH